MLFGRVFFLGNVFYVYNVCVPCVPTHITSKDLMPHPPAFPSSLPPNIGVPKHHICNANLMRNGADFAVYINTAQEFDGSDSGAKPDEAVSWGKIRMDARPVKVCADATIVFPLLVSQTFAKAFAKRKESKGAKGRFVSL